MIQSEQEDAALAKRLDAIRSHAASPATRRNRAVCEALSVLDLLARKLRTSPGEQVPALTPASLAAERQQQGRAIFRGGAR